MSKVRLALKEWAIITKALDRGRQILLIRKGGIREQQKRFVIEGDQFLLYPSYEHQKPDLVKPEFHGELGSLLASHTDDGTLTIANLARVEDALELTEPEAVDALSPFYICTNDYAQYRLRWRPKQPLSVLLLRVYRLPEPRTLPVLERYGGCTSWVELEQAIDTTGAAPVLTDDQFNDSVEAIRQSIEQYKVLA